MDFFELFDSLIDGVLLVLWWIVPAKLFKLDLNWLLTIPYKWLVVGWIIVFFIGVIVSAIGAMK